MIERTIGSAIAINSRIPITGSMTNERRTLCIEGAALRHVERTVERVRQAHKKILARPQEDETAMMLEMPRP